MGEFLTVRRGNLRFLLLFFLVLNCFISNTSSAKNIPESIKKISLQSFEQANHIQETSNSQSWSVYHDDTLLGFTMESNRLLNIPAYSGKPINLFIALDLSGVIRSVRILEHHEPILLVGIPEQNLFDFVEQYIEHKVSEIFKIGHYKEQSGYVSFDAITGATVTVKVLNQTLMRAARKIAYEQGILQRVINRSQAELLDNIEAGLSWQSLLNDNSISRLHISWGDVDKAFVGTKGEAINRTKPADQLFIDVYFSYLNSPAIGRTLLGDETYQWLMREMKPGEHAIAVMAEGDYSFRGSGFVRGGIFERFQISQGQREIIFRDLDYHLLTDLYVEGAGHFPEMGMFIIGADNEFEFHKPWVFELLVLRQVGALSSVFTNFSSKYQLPDKYYDLKEAPKSETFTVQQEIWQERSVEVILLIIALLIISLIVFAQDIAVKYQKQLYFLRRSILLFTVFFIGFYCLGQLSIVNIFTFTHSILNDFFWDVYLLDPVIFILWIYVAASVLLWGRGIYCGWLCPFGALQELLNEIAVKLQIKQLKLPWGLHERLWSLKYLILLVLFGISLQDFAAAEKYAEVEPFKTTFTLYFQREWWFVLYALLMIFSSLFSCKIYCRYLCPLGAALAIPSQIRLFHWLKRRKECGQPCQLCAVECEMEAIYPSGEINYNECHYCLDCQKTYYDNTKCPPLLLKDKKSRKSPNNDSESTVITVIENVDVSPK